MKKTNKERLFRRFAPDTSPAATHRLALGFGALLVLMLVITIIAVRGMEAGQRRLDRVVSQEMMKAKLAADMRLAARERTSALHQMALLTDPFDRDEQLMLFHGMADAFVVARERLSALPLNEHEQALLRRLGELTSQAAPLQEQVAALISAGHFGQAQAFLIEQAIPVQNRALEALVDLQTLQEQRATIAVAQADSAHRRDSALTIGLSALALILGAGIALGVLRGKARDDQALRDEKERALVTLGAIGDAVIRTDGAGRIEYLNPSAVQMTGWEIREAQGRSAGEVLRIMREHGQAAMDVAREVLIAGKAAFDLHQQMLQSRAGGTYSVEVNAVPIRDQEGGVSGVVIVLRDVTEIRALSRELVYHATHDALTGLLNRREFDRRLQEAIESSRRDGRSYLLCYLDLDLFKGVNDVCGHLAGDELLRQVGARLRSVVPPSDAVARIGGDEFAILLADRMPAEGEQIGDKIRRVVREHRFTWHNRSFDLGVSIGLVPICPGAGTVHDVLRSADHACRQAKTQGRNRVLIAQDGAASSPEMEVGWAETLGTALNQSGFALYGQWVYPLSDAGTAQPSHCEVLVRLCRDGEFISPSVFLAAAERYHIMPAIDRWVVRETFATLARHASPAGACFNINLSGQSLCDPDFLEFVLARFEDTGMPPSRICFEITETAAIVNMTSAMGFIDRLSGIGCSFALDDFGSGLSSFGYLKSMRVRYIKIDGVFVRDVAEDPVDRAMVWCINEMAHVMDIQTIAEYVESAAVRDELHAIGVDYVQGMFMAVPRPLAELLSEAESATGLASR